MALFILAIVIFITADVLIRMISKRMTEQKQKKEREQVLQESLKLDFTGEAKTLKRAQVDNPKARILCVDDEEVILGSFRKILVLDGYSVDTVENGQEALGLIQKHHYDFVFTDLKMPMMDGVEVCKSVKHLRPDIDVIIITGYASIETAVETMKYGALDYVEKPFTEDELIAFVKKSLIKRQDKIQKQLKPKVHITHLPASDDFIQGEFSIPGGVFIAKNHTWVSMNQEGIAKVGIDDFAQKLIGKVSSLELPNLGMTIKAGQPLFTIKQGNRTVTFSSPVSGKVAQVNTLLQDNLDALEVTPYERNWVCALDAENLDNEIKEMTIGKSAVTFFQDDIEKFKTMFMELLKSEKKSDEYLEDGLFIGQLGDLTDVNWNKIIAEFFIR
ncbi:MAG TPA: response regulator [Ignavibacteriaceae bacterium]|jgi:CheY-like chemotaxis protein|nr:MAG: Response regulator MprA [Ignavibacteria bacterium ADurb.Bin266]OQY73403.1 MAG: histidine kinase [Ignavibacteriales bacterium UTCHB2]HQF43462.1 response regulator [Ignavibacteriaceae bacterium]HQI40269.1 response regulator [Ignavibacteriaceae bacterium]